MSKNSKNQPQDTKTEKTIKTIESLKASQNVWKEFASAATNYQKASLKLAESGKVMSEALMKVGQLYQGDIGSAVLKLAEIHRVMETKRDLVSKHIADEVVSGILKSAKADENELVAFENDYRKMRTNLRGQIKKLEDESKKAGKKGPEVLKRAIQMLNDKIKEFEKLKSDKLRAILLIERKKYCGFMQMWLPVVGAEIDMFTDALRLKDNEPSWKQLANSLQTLSKEMEDLIKSTNAERTLVALGSGGGGNLDYDYTAYDNYDTSYDNGYDPNSGGGYDDHSNYGGGNYNVLGTCTALYDFSGEQATDLSFYTGDVINIVGEDDGSGWLSGEINGSVGIFPASYVKRN